MFIGHFAVAFAAKRAAPSVSLGTLFLAAQFADLLWPILVLLGVERFRILPHATAVTPLDFIHYPYSHSLAALIFWAFVLGGVYLIFHQSAYRQAVTIELAVISHWVLDWISHAPDMPLTPRGDARLGLGLWNSLAGTLLVEHLLLLGGVALYLRTTQSRNPKGRFGLVGLVTFLIAVNALNLLSGPPPGEMAVAWSANALWLLVAWGFWVDHHRSIAVRGDRHA